MLRKKQYTVWFVKLKAMAIGNQLQAAIFGTKFNPVPNPDPCPDPDQMVKLKGDINFISDNTLIYVMCDKCITQYILINAVKLFSD